MAFTTGIVLDVTTLLQRSSASYVGERTVVYTQGRVFDVMADLNPRKTTAHYFPPRAVLFSIFRPTKVLTPVVLPLGAIGAFPRGRELTFLTEDISSGERNVPLTNVEVLYPVAPAYQVDKDLVQMDSVEWRRNARAANQTLNLIRFRARFDEYVVLMDFLERYRLQQVILYTPGIYPFGRNYVRSYVRPLGYTTMQESERRFRIDARFQFLQGIA